MPSRCFEFVDSRLRRSPPDRASAVPMDKLGKRNAFPPPCPQVGGCPQASQQPQQRCENFVSGNDQPSSRLPAFSLFFPGSCPNNRDRRRELLARSLTGPLCEPREQHQQPRNVAARNRMF